MNHRSAIKILSDDMFLKKSSLLSRVNLTSHTSYGSNSDIFYLYNVFPNYLTFSDKMILNKSSRFNFQTHFQVRSLKADSLHRFSK